MPNTQTLQLYFDLTKAPGFDHGQFADDDPLHRSKVWIDQAGVATINDHLNINFNDNVAVSIQITTNLPALWQYHDFQGHSLRVSAVLWRNHTSAGNNATHDSPFTHNNQAGGRASTVFDKAYKAAQLAAGPVSLVLGTPHLKSGGVPGSLDRYIFLIAATLNVKDNLGVEATFTAGHDPRMDVSL